MRWIYGEVRDPDEKPIRSYKVNPEYIIAVDLNNNKLLVKDLNTTLFYNKNDEDLILKLIQGRE